MKISRKNIVKRTRKTYFADLIFFNIKIVMKIYVKRTWKK